MPLISGAPAAPTAAKPQPKASGAHWVEWGCEFVGTFVLLIGGTLAVAFGFLPSSPLHSLVHAAGWRRLITGILFVGTGTLVTLSPLGRRSGAHLNPAVSLAFFINKHSTKQDLGGYVVAQVLGALSGSAVLALVAHRWVTAPAVNYAITHPGNGIGTLGAALIEVAMTASVVLIIFGFVSSKHTAKFTPFAVWVVIATYVWAFAPYTGTSLNPARTFGPDAVAGTWPSFWIYLIGPMVGAVLACGIWHLLPGRTLTAKLFHDKRYRTTMVSHLPAMPAAQNP